jgi:hypothetical protein
MLFMYLDCRSSKKTQKYEVLKVKPNVGKSLVVNCKMVTKIRNPRQPQLYLHFNRTPEKGKNLGVKLGSRKISPFARSET